MGQYTSYYLYQKFEKIGNQDYIPVYPNVYSIDADGTMPTVVKEQNDVNCGYIPPVDPIYRWVDSGTTCVGLDKYQRAIKQVSNDGGLTWTNVSPAEYSATTIIEGDSPDCVYDYSTQYLTFVPTESATTFAFNSVSGDSISYSLDSGSSWTSLASGVSTPSVAVGQKIMWKASGLTVSSSYGIGKFSSSGKFVSEGNIMSLSNGDGFVSATTINQYQFMRLFSGNTKITSAENLILPATTLAESCYHGMFFQCSSLTTPPKLSATTLANRCYYEMFAWCRSLTTAPQLPATTLANSCYYEMFYVCESLTTAPQLPATTLANACYMTMFGSCRSLTAAPELPATTLTERCYSQMFRDCASLTSIPSNYLPVTTLTDYCYENMFNGCSGLTTAPVLSATTLTKRCYSGMFWGCKSLTTAPELPATTLTERCYYYMFNNCTSLNYVKCLATNISATDCTNYWLNNVSSTGTFVKNSSMSWWPTGVNGIPSNWTVQNA